MITAKKALDILIPKGLRLLAERTEKEVPATGRFGPVSVSFDYPGTDYQAFLRVEPSARGDGTERCLRSYMRQAGSDKAVSHYLFTGTKAQLLVWLREKSSEKELRKSYAELKESVDRFD